MKRLTHILLILLLIQANACNGRTSVDTRKLSNRAFSGNEIQDFVYPHIIIGNVYLPKQNTKDRVILLNKLLENNGFTPNQIRIIVGPELETSIIFEEAHFKNPTFSDVLKFNRGRRALRYYVSNGVIKIEPQKDGE